MKKNIKFIVLLCANIVFFVSCVIALISSGSYFFDYWHIEFVLQCAFSLVSVAVDYLIDLAQSVKKLLNQKESENTHSSDCDKTET